MWRQVLEAPPLAGPPLHGRENWLLGNQPSGVLGVQCPLPVGARRQGSLEERTITSLSTGPLALALPLAIIFRPAVSRLS